MASEYHVAFDTRSRPGYVVTTKIVISNDVLASSDESVRIDLVNHPLYPDLEKYVLANSRKTN